MRLHGGTIDWTRFSPQPGDDIPCAFFIQDHRYPGKQDYLLYGLHQSRYPQDHRAGSAEICTLRGKDHRHRAPILPLDRSESRPIPPSQAPPILPGAGRSGHGRGLHQRHILLLAHGDSKRGAAEHPWSRPGGDICVPPMLSSTTPLSPHSCFQPWKPEACPTSIWLARSTGPRATKKRLLKA